MRKMIEVNALAQNNSRCKNLQNSIDEQGYDSPNSASFGHELNETVPQLHL